MITLKLEFEVPLQLKSEPGDIVATTALLPLPARRCLAFGWASLRADGIAADERYWLAAIGADGVRHRFLGTDVTARLVDLTGRPRDSSGGHTRILAFRHGDGFGLLLGSQEVHLYADVDAQPVVLPIDGDFSPLAAKRLANSRHVGHYQPLHCGPAADGVVPVVLSAPDGNGGEGRHAALLQIVGDRARWQLTDREGAPRGTRYADVAPMLSEPQIGAIRLFSPDPHWNNPPLIQDALWDGDGWTLYVAGFHGNAHRFGLAPSLLSRHAPDLAMREALFQAGEDSFGRFCAARDRLILSPLKKGGPAKDKQTIVTLADRIEHPVKLPRGYAKHSVVDFGDGTYWLLPARWGYPADSVVACSGEAT